MSVLAQVQANNAAEAARRESKRQADSITSRLQEISSDLSALQGAIADVLGKIGAIEMPETDLSPVLAEIKNQSRLIAALAKPTEIKFPPPVDLNPILEEIRSMELAVELPEEKKIEKLTVVRDANQRLKEVIVVYG